MKKLATGIIIAASAAALTACTSTQAPSATENVATTQPVAENNAEAPMANGTGNMVDSSGGDDNATMVGNDMSTNNSTDPHGSSSGH